MATKKLNIEIILKYSVPVFGVIITAFMAFISGSLDSLEKAESDIVKISHRQELDSLRDNSRFVELDLRMVQYESAKKDSKENFNEVIRRLTDISHRLDSAYFERELMKRDYGRKSR